MIPKRIPTVAADRMLASWQAIGLGELMIQLELEFEGRLDLDRLARALDLVLDAEPALGCRFVSDGRRAYWERLDPGARGTLLMASGESEFEGFKHLGLDNLAGPLLKAIVWRDSGGDRVLLKVAHAVADAGGVKHLAATLSAIYRRLAADPAYVPAPNLKGSRSIWQLARRLPWRAHPRVVINFLREMWSNSVPRLTHALPIAAGPPQPFVYVVRHLARDRVGGLSAYGRARQATLNDLMMAAFLRASARLGRWDGQAQLRLQTTVDLRRYLRGERAGGICNLSAFDHANLGTDLGDDFAATLARVSAITRRRKADWTGLTLICAAPLLRQLSYASFIKLFESMRRWETGRHNFPNTLTNMGPIRSTDVDFGDPVRGGWLLTPPIYPPAFGAGLSGYGGGLTISAGVPRSSLPAVEPFIDGLLAELPG